MRGMMQHDQPADQQHRDRIQQNLDENLFVEAGAGTGKTTALVGRIVTLIASGAAEMAGLAAITFTEAAAAELRDRVRRDLECAAEDDSRDVGSRDRCRRAVSEMDAASVQTLHSFAQSLLRELPLEAGLPPGFEMLDPIEADLRFQQAWDQWLDESLESVELGPKLARALHLGLNLDQLRRVASALNGDYDLVADTSIAEAPEPTLTIGNRLAEVGHGDRAAATVFADWRQRSSCLNTQRRSSPWRRGCPLWEAATAPTSEPSSGCWVGSGSQPEAAVRTNWDKDDVAGVNACKLLKDMLLEPLRVCGRRRSALCALPPSRPRWKRYATS